MSAVVDELDQLEAATVSLPWPPGVFSRLGMPSEAKSLLYALTASWPELKKQLTSLEARVADLEAQMAEARRERQSIVAGTTLAARELLTLQASLDSVRSDLSEQVRVAEHQRDAAIAARDRVPARLAAAEKVCASIRTTMPGPRRAIPSGAHGWFDGSAYDQWRRNQ